MIEWKCNKKDITNKKRTDPRYAMYWNKKRQIKEFNTE